MEASKAEEIATSPDELQDLQDDQLIHQQTEPEPEPERPELEDELTNDIIGFAIGGYKKASSVWESRVAPVLTERSGPKFALDSESPS